MSVTRTELRSTIACQTNRMEGRMTGNRQPGADAALVSVVFLIFAGAGRLQPGAAAHRASGAGAADRSHGGAVRRGDSRHAGERRLGD